MQVEKKTVILTIDDESVIRDSICAYLEDYDYTVLEAKNGRIGLAIAEREKIDCILVDLRMPEMDGLEVLSTVRRSRPEVPIIVISGTGEISDVVEALRLGAWDYLLKPITDMSILLHAIEKCLERARLIEENDRYQQLLEELVEMKTRELSMVNARLKEVVESTKILLGCGEIEESGQLLLQEFARHMKATGGSIFKVVDNGLKHIASLGGGRTVDLIPFPLEKDSVFSRVMEDHEPLFLTDIGDDASIVSRGGSHYRDNSLLVFPITDGRGEMLAIISLHSKIEPPFVSQDRDIGRILASYSCEVLRVATVSAALKNSEARLLQAQKMEAIGTLAGGIAHDFNNILAAIVGYTDLSLLTGFCDDKVRKNLEQVKKAGNRAKDLVTQILTFSRTEQYKEKAVDIGPVIREALKLLRATIPSSIDIQYDIPDGMGKVMTDPTRIYQVLMNLCTNAAHAMRNSEGRLSIRYRRVDSREMHLHGLDGEKKWSRLSVADTGTGIPKELVDRIFDPYFTTKNKGEGTGLGLSVVHGIVRSSGGLIRVESQPGAGSTFYLYFPSVEEKESIPEEIALQTLSGGRERILFVDDEATLAEMTGEMLEKLGYAVTILSSSSEALQLFRKSPYSFDLLITDQTMPDMSGIDLARQVLQLRPGIPVILYTGYSAAINAAEVKQIGIRRFLMKPLTMNDLAEAVRQTLDGFMAVDKTSSGPGR